VTLSSSSATGVAAPNLSLLFCSFSSASYIHNRRGLRLQEEERERERKREEKRREEEEEEEERGLP